MLIWHSSDDRRTDAGKQPNLKTFFREKVFYYFTFVSHSSLHLSLDTKYPLLTPGMTEAMPSENRGSYVLSTYGVRVVGFQAY